MSGTGKKVNMKKVIKIVLVCLALFLVLNLFGAAIGTSASITHPKGPTYDEEIISIKERLIWGNFDDYVKEDYIVKGMDEYDLHCTKVSSFNTAGTGRYVIISHGHKSNKYGDVKYCDPYINLGFTCIIYDLRAHGENAKAICSMGGYEAIDLNCIIEDTFSRYEDVEILGLQGESMGTSATLNALNYTDKVDFVVADCGFESLKFMLHDMYNDMHLYPFGFCADIGFKIFYNINTSKISAIDAIRGKDVPILFVHGAADDWIDVENSEDMYSVARESCYTEFWLVPEAEHADSRQIAGEEAYEEHIANFLINAGVIESQDEALFAA